MAVGTSQTFIVSTRRSTVRYTGEERLASPPLDSAATVQIDRLAGPLQAHRAECPRVNPRFVHVAVTGFHRPLITERPRPVGLLAFFTSNILPRHPSSALRVYGHGSMARRRPLRPRGSNHFAITTTEKFGPEAHRPMERACSATQ